MKRKLLFRCLLGAPLGLALSTAITVAISLMVGDGNYYPVVPALSETMGGELNAVLLQSLFSLFYGAIWGGSSLIWELERWSLLRQTVIHLAVTCAATFPIAWLMQWMGHTATGVLAYCGIFLSIYLIIWLSQYLSIKKRIQAINDRLEANHRDQE